MVWPSSLKSDILLASAHDLFVHYKRIFFFLNKNPYVWCRLRFYAVDEEGELQNSSSNRVSLSESSLSCSNHVRTFRGQTRGVADTRAGQTINCMGLHRGLANLWWLEALETWAILSARYKPPRSTQLLGFGDYPLTLPQPYLSYLKAQPNLPLPLPSAGKYPLSWHIVRALAVPSAKSGPEKLYLKSKSSTSRYHHDEAI